MTYTTDCPLCLGGGELHGERCYLCAGSGKVTREAPKTLTAEEREHARAAVAQMQRTAQQMEWLLQHLGTREAEEALEKSAALLTEQAEEFERAMRELVGDA